MRDFCRNMVRPSMLPFVSVATLAITYFCSAGLPRMASTFLNGASGVVNEILSNSNNKEVAIMDLLLLGFLIGLFPCVIAHKCYVAFFSKREEALQPSLHEAQNAMPLAQPENQPGEQYQPHPGAQFGSMPQSYAPQLASQQYQPYVPLVPQYQPYVHQPVPQYQAYVRQQPTPQLALSVPPSCGTPLFEGSKAAQIELDHAIAESLANVR